jgi:phosphoserine/homoserine phosphotransferase
MGGTSFFCNKECEHFPCHDTDNPEEFNCLFCYCPLYAYGESCGGNFKYTKKGIKSCIDCTVPHGPDSAEYINKKLKELRAGKRVERVLPMVCLDLEGVLFPEIWEAIAQKTGIADLKLTTRDEPDYDKLMKHRLDIVSKNDIKLDDIISIISSMEPLPGAKDFLDKLRSRAATLIISDTFTQFAKPVAIKLGMPGILCNKLEIDDDGRITGYRMRCPDTKVSVVKAFQNLGYYVIAAGDGFNDIDMIAAADAGFFINPPAAVYEKYAFVPSFHNLDELYKAITAEIDKI